MMSVLKAEEIKNSIINEPFKNDEPCNKERNASELKDSLERINSRLKGVKKRCGLAD
jgi:hypothetical protein